MAKAKTKTAPKKTGGSKVKVPTRESIQGTFASIRSLIEGAQDDADKFALKGINAAGSRIRKAAQEVKKLCMQLRKDVQAVKNSGK